MKINTQHLIPMKKSTFLVLIIALWFGNAAYCQDTLRLFGHKEKKETQPVPDTLVPVTPPAPKPVSNNEIKTLTGPGGSTGFYFGFYSTYSQVAGYDAFGFGGTFAMIANHGLAIGLSGSGFFTEPYETIHGSNTNYSYTGGYGGILIEPIIFPKYPVHVSFPILLGAGGIAKSVFNDYYYTEIYWEDSEAFMIVEPAMELEFNVARWMRLSIRGSYRITTSLEASTFESNPMNGFTGGFSLKFGKF
jgi:hypothetical protein